MSEFTVDELSNLDNFIIWMHKRSHITIRQLETLAAVVHYGTLSKAAESLNISQPALSRTLSNLEDQLGISLFLREKKRLVLTGEGRILADRTRNLLEGVTDLERLAVDLKSLRRGRLCVVSISAFSNGILSDCVAGLLEHSPQLEIAVRAQSEAMILEWVATREADLGVTMLDVTHSRVASDLLFDVDAVCVLHRSHPMAAQDVIRPEHLEGSRFIRFCSDTQTSGRFERQLGGTTGIGSSTLEVYSSMSACELVRRNLGVALTDPFTAIAYAEWSEIVMRPFSIPIPYNFYLLRPLHRPQSELATTMIGLIRERAVQIANSNSLKLRLAIF
ncbi:LysR substrate-binding domain-containing protein [Hoeflea sp. CAU 1731]